MTAKTPAEPAVKKAAAAESVVAPELKKAATAESVVAPELKKAATAESVVAEGVEDVPAVGMSGGDIINVDKPKIQDFVDNLPIDARPPPGTVIDDVATKSYVVNLEHGRIGV